MPSRAPRIPRHAAGVTLPSYRGDNVNRPGFSVRGARAGSGAVAARLRARLAHPQLRARAHRRRFRRSAPPGVLGPRLPAPRGPARCLSEDRRFDCRVAGVLRVDEWLARCTQRPGSSSIPATKACICLSEQAQTRYIDRQKKWYNLSTHMPWIGMRTAQIEGGAHRVLSRHRQSDRREGGRFDERGMAAGAGRGSESAESSPAASRSFTALE